MWAVRVYDPEGFYEDYYFRREENAEAFLKKEMEEFIERQSEGGYEPFHFGFDTYEEMLKDGIEYGEMVDVAVLYKLEYED